MKKLFSILLVLAASAAFAQAPQGECKNPPPQPPPHKTAEERASHFSDRMEKDLGLDADQKKKVQALALTREQEMDKLREAHKGQEKSTWANERKKVRDDFDAGMKKTLSPEQLQKWEQIKKDRKAGKMPPPPANGENPPPPPPPVDED